MVRLQDIRSFLYTSRLFGDGLTCTRQNAISEVISTHEEACGQTLKPCTDARLCLVKSGKVDLLVGARVIESLGPGDFFNESTVLFDTPCLFKAQVSKDSTIYTIPGEVLSDIPIVRWKLLELYERRLSKTVSHDNDKSFFEWQPEYCVNVATVDEQHQQIFAMAKVLYAALFEGVKTSEPEKLFPRLIEHTALHFQTENKLMVENGYPGFALHAKRHEQIIRALSEFAAFYAAKGMTPKKEVGIFLKDWVMTHILTDDRRMGTYLNRKGII
jgi:hemerythrin